VNDVRALCSRIATLHQALAATHRELAEVQAELGAAMAAPSQAPQAPDQALRLEAAAALMGETPAVFLRRPEYEKASIRRPGERIHRFSRRALERILADRVASR